MLLSGEKAHFLMAPVDGAAQSGSTPQTAAQNKEEKWRILLSFPLRETLIHDAALCFNVSTFTLRTKTPVTFRAPKQLSKHPLHLQNNKIPLFLSHLYLATVLSRYVKFIFLVQGVSSVCTMQYNPECLEIDFHFEDCTWNDTIISERQIEYDLVIILVLLSNVKYA